MLWLWALVSAGGRPGASGARAAPRTRPAHRIAHPPAQCHHNVISVFNELESHPSLFRPSARRGAAAAARGPQQQQQEQQGQERQGPVTSYESLPSPLALSQRSMRHLKSSKLRGMVWVIAVSMSLVALLYCTIGAPPGGLAAPPRQLPPAQPQPAAQPGCRPLSATIWGYPFPGFSATDLACRPGWLPGVPRRRQPRHPRQLRVHQHADAGGCARGCGRHIFSGKLRCN